MNVCIISCFRDATAYIDRYCAQMDELQGLLHARGDSLTLLIGYGDSTDDTDALLFEACVYRFDARMIDVTHGGPKFGSVVDAQRFRQLARMGNKLLDNVPGEADVVGFVESDLIWDADTLVQLIDHIQDYVAVAPLVLDGPKSFYDIFAFRRNGRHFTKYHPYHADLNGTLIELDSAGSVIFADADLARKARLSDGEAIVGWCNGIREQGGNIYCDPSLTVAHPPYAGGQRPGEGAARNSDHLRVRSHGTVR